MLKDEIARIWGIKKVTIIPVVIPTVQTDLRIIFSNWNRYESRTCTKNSLIGNSKDFKTGTWILQKIINTILQDLIGHLISGCCPVSQN